ncbi:MAG: acetyl-CoA C-acyltransferase [Alphaproteobacteria bacterium]
MPEIFIAAGVRSPFSKIDGALKEYDAIALSVPVAQAMIARLKPGTRPDFAVWGSVVPNLGWSNIAREIWLDAELDPTVPAYSIILACASSMTAAVAAGGMLQEGVRDLAIVGGVEAMSRVQIGLNQNFSDWLRHFIQARSLGAKLEQFTELHLHDVRLHIPAIINRTTGMSMGEHTEITAKEWHISRAAQDAWALKGHARVIAARERGFFNDLIVPVGTADHDTIPRADTSLEKLAKLPPAFDRTSGKGTLTAGNSSPVTDGAASVWVANANGLKRLPDGTPFAKLIDYEITSVDLHNEGLLMAPSYAIPRMFARRGLRYDDIDLWEIHEAFAAQVLANVAALEDKAWIKRKTGIERDFGPFPWERANPNGSAIAIGHPFAATGARDLSQCVKELFGMKSGARAIVSICADGGQGAVALLERP